MKRDVIMPASKFHSSFLSCEKDAETILKRPSAYAIPAELMKAPVLFAEIAGSAGRET